MSDAKKYSISSPKTSLSKEAAIAYGSSPKASKLEVVSRKTNVSDLEKIALIRSGISKGMILKVADLLGVSLEEICDLIHISSRTLQRKSLEDTFGPLVSERVVEIADVLLYGVEVLEDLSLFQSWLRSSPPIFDGQTALSYLDTAIGCQFVHTVLGRIEYGVYS